MPVKETKDCVVVDGKLYCRQEGEVTNKQFGIMLLIVVFAAIYILAAAHVAINVYDRMWLFPVAIFIPVVIIALYLIFG